MKNKKGQGREPSLRTIKAFKLATEKGGNLGAALREAGFARQTSLSPKKVTQTTGWQKLMAKYLPDKLLATKHHELLNSTTIEHMIFPLKVSDEEIKELLKSVNCTVRKIQHGESGNHCWYWSADNKARKDALDMAYKLKGRYSDKDVDLQVDNHFKINITTLDGGHKLGTNKTAGLGVAVSDGQDND